MAELCACDKYMVERKDATFVSDGRPCHNAKCYHDAEARRVERQMQMLRNARALRRTPFSDEDDADRVACPYGKSPSARFQDV